MSHRSPEPELVRWTLPSSSPAYKVHPEHGVSQPCRACGWWLGWAEREFRLLDIEFGPA